MKQVGEYNRTEVIKLTSDYRTLLYFDTLSLKVCGMHSGDSIMKLSYTLPAILDWQILRTVITISLTTLYRCSSP